MPRTRKQSGWGQGFKCGAGLVCTSILPMPPSTFVVKSRWCSIPAVQRPAAADLLSLSGD